MSDPKDVTELRDVLAEGEVPDLVAEGLVRESGVTFDKCKIVLTPIRLIVLKQGWPWGFKVDRSIPRMECSVKNSKERFDGSVLVLIKHAAGVLCLYFHRADAEAAATLRIALGGETEVVRLDG